MFRSVLRPSSGMSIQKRVQKDTIKILRVTSYIPCLYSVKMYRMCNAGCIKSVLYIYMHICNNFMFMGPCIAILCQQMSNKMQLYTVYFICKLLYMFRVVSPPIIRSTHYCIYSSCSCSTGWLVTDAVDTAICAPDDGLRNHQKHVDQFTENINCVQLHLVGHLLTFVRMLDFLKICIICSCICSLYRHAWGWPKYMTKYLAQVRAI